MNATAIELVAGGQTGSSPPDAGRERVPRGRNVLVRSLTVAPREGRPCATLFDVGGEAPDYGLWVTYARAADEELADWSEPERECLPELRGVVAVGDRSGAADDVPTRPTDPVVRTVPEPTDLTRLGDELSAFFESWDPADGRLAVCFDSLTPLLVYVSVDRARRFLRALTARVRAHGATAHYHLNPDVHAPRTVERLVPLFDEVVEYAADGNLTRLGAGN